MKPLPKLLLVSACVVFAAGSCSKVPPVNPPIPYPILHSLEEFPFHSWLDSIQAQAPGIEFTFSSGGLFDQLVTHGEVPGQCETSLAFRSSVAGVVTSLGLLEPASGYQHTVTLWDSATREVLAQVNVPSLDSGHWTTVSLALDGKEVPIQANHGYIVGFNTLAVGDAIGEGSPGDDVTVLYGIWDYRDNPNTAPGLLFVFPFTWGPITFENQWQIYYDTPISAPGFPGDPGTIQIPDNHTVLGPCDIGFIPAPQ
jgi:hypothetical protein